MKESSSTLEYLQKRGVSLPSNLSREEMACVEMFLFNLIESGLALNSIESLVQDTPVSITVSTVDSTERHVWSSHRVKDVLRGFEILQRYRTTPVLTKSLPAYTLRGKVLHTHGSNDQWNAVLTICESDVVTWREGSLIILRNDKAPFVLRPSVHLGQEFKDKMLCDIFEALTSERPEKR